MIQYLLASTIGLGISFFLFLFFLKKEKCFRFNRFYLLGSLVLSLLAPTLELDFGTTFWGFSGIDVAQLNATDLASQHGIASHTVETMKSHIDFHRIVIAIYLMVSGLFLLRLGRNIISIVKRIRISEIIKLNGMSVVTLEEKCDPHSFFHYLFACQNEWENNTIPNLVFAHEKSHAQQVHSLDVVFIEVLTCFLWVNPFVWLYKHAMVENHEFLADSVVMKNGGNLEFYTNMLIQSGNKLKNSPLISGFKFHQTKNRINMLYKQSKSKFVLTVKAGVVLTLFSLVFALSSFSGNSGHDPFIVVIDPGHGGSDAGAIEIEKAINLQIANKLAALSEEGLVEIILTRNNDVNLPLYERVNFAQTQKADLFLSLHCSASKNHTKSGIVAYYSKNNNEEKMSHSCSKILVAHYLKNIAEKGEIKTANYFVLRELEIPGVLLELGYLTNPEEANQLQSHEFQQKIAKNIYEGLIEIKSTL